MKKSLLILGTLVLSVSANAQATTYVGNNAKFYVSQQASVYSGGEWKLDSGVEKSVLNEGDIAILGKYTKGSNNTADGKEFLNKYIGEKKYGQVKILNTSTATDTDARMTMEKPAAHSNYYGASYAISFPYNDNVKYIMHSFKKEESEFKGTCPKGELCGTDGKDRYKMTLTKWNNDKLQHDAVLAEDSFIAGDYYNINLREQDMQTVMVNNVSYKGKPDGTAYAKTAKGVVSAYSGKEQDFSNEGYNDWKEKTNEYGEKYKSYLGDVSTTSKLFGKNIYRFGNPYTSNLDITAVEGNNAWLKIVKSSTDKNLKEAYAEKLVKGVSITKRTNDYDINWGDKDGAVNVTANYYKAQYDGMQWTGNAEALLIRPLETFNVNFGNVNNKNLGSRVLDIKVNFTDAHKTFQQTVSGGTALTSGPGENLPITFSHQTLENTSAGQSAFKNKYEFNQLEMFLVEDNKIETSPAYIVGANYYEESGEENINLDKIFVYGIENDKVAYNSQKEFNAFNSKTYIAKPLGIGFNGLKEGNTYQLRFNLYEGSIFNKVVNLSDGVFFLKDTLENKAIEIDANKSYTFVANGNVDKRFIVYWKKMPSVDDTIIDTIDSNAKKTIVYKDGTINKLRFETNEQKAKVDIYNAAGRLVSSEQDLSTDADYTLNLDAQGMYVVRVVYYNGEVRVLKVMNY